MFEGQTWSQYEIDYLTKWYGKKFAKEIAIDLNRSYESVRSKAQRLYLSSFLKFKKPKTQTKEEKNLKDKIWKSKNIEKCRASYAKSKADKISKNKKIVSELAQQCAICGETNKYTLEFHHINPRNGGKTIGYMVCNGYGEQTLLNELKKCQVLCRNCHRLQHVKNYKNMSKKIRFVHNIKQKLSCSLCQKSGPPILDFHHIDETEKIDDIGAMTRSSKYSVEDIKNEILKTCIVCGNCHRKIHWDDSFNPELTPLNSSLI